MFVSIHTPRSNIAVINVSMLERLLSDTQPGQIVSQINIEQSLCFRSNILLETMLDVSNAGFFGRLRATSTI